MRRIDDNRAAARVGAARSVLRAALLQALQEVGSLSDPTAAASEPRTAAIRRHLTDRVSAFVQVLREAGIRESEIAPMIRKSAAEAAEGLAAPRDSQALALVLAWSEAA